MSVDPWTYDVVPAQPRADDDRAPPSRWPHVRAALAWLAVSAGLVLWATRSASQTIAWLIVGAVIAVLGGWS